MQTIQYKVRLKAGSWERRRVQSALQDVLPLIVIVPLANPGRAFIPSEKKTELALSSRYCRVALWAPAGFRGSMYQPWMLSVVQKGRDLPIKMEGNCSTNHILCILQTSWERTSRRFCGRKAAHEKSCIEESTMCPRSIHVSERYLSNRSRPNLPGKFTPLPAGTSSKNWIWCQLSC